MKWRKDREGIHYPAYRGHGERGPRLKESSVAKIKERASGQQPFFHKHCFMKVHADNFASREFEGKSDSKDPYKDCMVEVDAYIGAIVKALDDAGVPQNAFIFVTSDNGLQMDSWLDSGYTPFKGSKNTSWEGGVRVPGVAYWRVSGMCPRKCRKEGSIKGEERRKFYG